MKRVLVTGASGFIGRHSLKPLLSRGFEVHGVRRDGRNTQSDPAVIWHTVDLLDTEATRTLLRKVRASHLLHFAWYSTPGKYWTATENLLWVTASLELFQAFASAGGTRVVVAGTCAEYDWSYGFLSEDKTPLAPATLYGTCKNSLREILEKLAPLVGLSWAWGRTFYLYGPYEDPGRLVPSVTLALLRGERARCSTGRQLRDYLYVEDMARAFAILLDSTVEGSVNLGSGNAVSVRSIVYHIATYLEARHRVDFGALSAPPGDPPIVRADNRRLCEQVGWAPDRTLGQGLDATVDWWRKHCRGL